MALAKDVIDQEFDRRGQDEAHDSIDKDQSESHGHATPVQEKKAAWPHSMRLA